MIRIAVDGLSGSGKGALCAGLAKEFHLKHLDTGAIFRTMGVHFLNNNTLEPTENSVKFLLSSADIKFVFEGNSQKMFLNGNDVTNRLREEKVSQLASKVSAFAFAREKYLEIVRRFSYSYDCVIDGRDITTVVMPDADVKIYLTADETIRAKRRYDENVQRNIDCTFEEVLANLKERDYRDTHRDNAPLTVAEDAIYVDNTLMDIEQTIFFCSERIKQILSAEGKI